MVICHRSTMHFPVHIEKNPWDGSYAMPPGGSMIACAEPVFTSETASYPNNFRASVSLIALLCGLGCAPPSFAQSLPTGATVTSGKVSIGSTSPNSLTVNQSSRTGIVNWSSFSVGQGNHVQFNNGSGATLNRVTGNLPSSINGTLSATGSVYLVNPSGVVVGPSGEIKTGGSFVASTLDVKDAEFRAGGALTFSGNSTASVVNLGKIGASKGDVVLIARQVRNEGSVVANAGTAAMATGGEVVLSDGSLGNGKVLVRRPAEGGEIRNSGAIRAAEVELRANGGNIYALAGNTGRAITATGVASKGGRIFLTAEGGSVNVTQKVVARRVQAGAVPTRGAGRRAVTGGDVVITGEKVVVGGRIAARGNGGTGGTVVVTGGDVTLTSGAAIDAGGTAGGTVLIGGDRAGGSDAGQKFLPQAIANAKNVTIEAGATIAADGSSGAGGNVVVWSDGTTSFGGAISTRGGRGGFIETSGHVFNFAGGSVNAGSGGSWLLDPVDLTIDGTLAGTIAAALNGGSDVTQLTNASGSGGNGDITVASGISWSTGATLTLSAYRNVAVNADIASSGGGGVVLRADNAGNRAGTVTFGGGQVSTAGAVSLFYNPTGSSSTINATKYTAPMQTNFGSYVTGGGTLNTYMLVNTVHDLQNMKNNLAGAYALGRDIDASVTSGWNSGAGFEPVGGSTAFTGTFDGQGLTIANLTINRPSGQWVGLFGYNGASATVSNLGLLNVSVTGNTATGGVVGENHGTIAGVYTSGSVASNAGAGGIVGYNYGSLSNVYSTSAVSAPASYAGGIAGLSLGSISQAYATGPVSGGSNVGGLVGYLGGSISQSYATGAVSGTSNVGGLLGYNGGSITQSYWDSYTTGQAAGIGAGAASGGLNEVTSDPAQSGAANDAYRQSAYTGFDFTPDNTSTGWFSIDGQTRPFGQWEYSTNIANAHQLQLMAMNLDASYRLTSNIDFAGGFVGDKYPGMWSQAGFSPIGNLFTQFRGSLDGQNHVISNLSINLPSTSYVGLFGYTTATSTLGNVSLQAATVTGHGQRRQPGGWRPGRLQQHRHANHRRFLRDRRRDRHDVRRRTGRRQLRGSFHRQFLRGRSCQRGVVDRHHIVRRRTDRHQLRGCHAVPCERDGERDVHLCSGHGHVGGRADRQQRQHGDARTVLRDRCGQRRLGRRDDSERWIGREERRRGHCHAVLCDRCGQCHLNCRSNDGGRTDRHPQQHRYGHANLRDRHGRRCFDVQHGGGRWLDRIGYRRRARHVVLLGHCHVREGQCRRQRRKRRPRRPDHQPDAESGNLCVNLRGLGFRHRLVGAERRLLPAALWRQLRVAGRSCQRVAGLWRRQSGIHLFDLRFSCRGYGCDRQRPLGLDGGDGGFECRQLRDQCQWRQCRQRLRPGLSHYRCAGHADRYATVDHRHGG